MLATALSVVVASFVTPLTESLIVSAGRPLRRGLLLNDASGDTQIEGLTRENAKRLFEALTERSSEDGTDEMISSSKADNTSQDFQISGIRTLSPTPTEANTAHPPGIILVSPVFKLVFITVVILTVASGLGATIMAFAADSSHANQQAIFETMGTTWKLGLGAIFGLLGGKTVT